MNPVYDKEVRKWDVFEISLEGPSEGNPFAEQNLQGIFTGREESKVAEGFYDGNGIYRIRFMPSFAGKYSFVLRASFLKEAVCGVFYVQEAEEENRGPVHVSDTYHFAYADGTPFHPVGTTAYVWHLQSEDALNRTLASLQEARFNKIRFCIFPKHFVYNLKDPDSFPYEGTPMDASVLNEDNWRDFIGKAEGNDFDYTRFSPAYFRHIEECIRELGKIGVEADLIVLHPYDRWGFSAMTREQDELYWRYVIARFAAYHNVWWSLANEYDLMASKTSEDWEFYGSLLVKKDPYRHLRSIHNCRRMYDHSRPWITHCSVQRTDLYKGAELTDELREKYGKPVVMDEIAYEGNLPYGWGNISAEEMLRRFWETALRGGYPGHGETYLDDPDEIWWSHGGTLRGESWKRFELLLDILDEVPGSGLVYTPMEWDSVCATPESEWSLPVKSMYLFYYSFMRPSYRDFHIDDDTDFVAEVIDTWNMKIRTAGIFKGKFRVALPGTRYMAVRLRKAQEEDYEERTEKEEPEEEIVLPVSEEIAEEAADTEMLETAEPAEEPVPEEAEETPAEEEPKPEASDEDDFSFDDDLGLEDEFLTTDTDDLFLNFEDTSSKDIKVDTINLEFPEDISEDDEFPDIVAGDTGTLNVPVFRYDD